MRLVGAVEELRGREPARGGGGGGGARAGRRARPVDPEEARRGQADFVKVRDWRGGRGEVGDLEVERVVASVPGAPRGTGGAAGGPLFPELVARMRLLEAQGELGVAGEGRLPPPEEWALSGDHLADFLRGLLAVHGALEGAVSAGSAGAGGGPEGRHALARLEAAASLPRSVALEAALGTLGGPGPASGGSPPAEAKAYAQYLADLGRVAGGEGGDESQAACLKIVAHFFALHLMHATSFQNLLAKGSARLGLPSLSAAEGYRLAGSSGGPVGALQAAVDAAGGEVSSAEGIESVASEVRKAMQKTTVLVLPLAKPA